MRKPRRKEDTAQTFVVLGAVFFLLAGLAGYAYDLQRAASASPETHQAGISVGADGFAYQRAERPNRTLVTDAAGNTVAVMTDGARTARITGPARIFAEPKYTKAKVHTDAWIRLAPQPWKAGGENEPWFDEWFPKALKDQSPDALAIMFEYAYGAPPAKNPEGKQIAGDASFGPIVEGDVDGRAENSDFYDYIGIPYEFPDAVSVQPNSAKIGAIDCSGFIRMVYGYRMGFPLLGGNNPGPGLNRRAKAMAEFGPGAQVVPNTGRQVRELGLLQPGDLLFFHGYPENVTDALGAANDLEKHIEHSGIYLGLDDFGHHRFISSRPGINGPTMGDSTAESIIDGTGHFAIRLRTAWRL